MKLASFIVLSAALHGGALVLPTSIRAPDGEPFTPVILVTLEEAGGAPGKGGTVENKVRSSMPRARATQIISDQQITELGKTGARGDAMSPVEVSVTVSEGLSVAISSESMSHGVDIFGVGDGGGFGRASTGTGNSEAGSGAGTGRGTNNGEGQYRQARASDAPKPRYPESARRDGKEGRVLLRVLVNEEGRSASVEVNRSSGVESLDQAALEAIKRWRFSPARLGDRPVESWVRIPIDFRLTDVRD